MNGLQHLSQIASKATHTVSRFIKGTVLTHVPLCATAMLGVVGIVMACAVSLNLQQVTICDDGTMRRVLTLSENADTILSEAGVSLQADDMVTASLQTNPKTIDITRAFDVTITIDNDVTTVVRMTGGTVTDALAHAGVSLQAHDLTNLQNSDPLTGGLNIQVETLDYEDRVVTEPLNYVSTTKYSDELVAGLRQVTQEGQKGEKTIVYRDYMENGKVVRTEVISETMTKQPVNEVITMGAGSMAPKPADLVLDENGIPVSYTKVMSGVGCAYTSKKGSGARTSTGTVPQVGTVAVNPKLIPYGSKLYIVSEDGYVYGYGVASDTGGDLLNNKITVDLYMDTVKDCYTFGRRQVKIYILN